MVFLKNCNLSHSFVLFKICQIKLCNDVLDRSIAFLDSKNIDFQKSQNLHFFKGVSPWFLSKIVNFLKFSF